jgi:very-short-patch-repair endonuclease/prophage antirepressor-like protein
MKWNLFKEIDVSNKMTTEAEIIEYQVESSSEEETEKEIFSDKELIVYNDNPEKKDYFVGQKVAELIGYTNTQQAIHNNVKDENKICFKNYNGLKEPKLNSNVVLITKDGIEDLLMKKKELDSKAIDVLSKINIDVSMFIKETDLEDEDEESEEESELTTYSYINNGYCFEYFVGFEITTLLGYKKPTSALINVSKSNKIEFRDYPGSKKPMLDPQTILITRDGAIEILLKTRKRLTPDVIHILKTFNIETTNRKCLTKEQQTLSSITDVFKTEKYEDQYKIGKYYLDLFFTDYKIVIECDENGHADRKPWKERERMDYVNENLEITDDNWIRFNPDEFRFDISTVIGQIYRKIDEIKEIRNKEEIARLLEENKMQEAPKKEGSRKCKDCKIVQDINEFSPSGTGTSTCCKKCSLLVGVGNEKPVNQYDLDGKFIKRFNSSGEAEKITGFKAKNIRRNCRGVIKSTKNYIWRYVEDVIKEKKSEEEHEYEIEEDESDKEASDETLEAKLEVKFDEDIKIRNNSLIKTVAQYKMDGTFIKTHISGHEAAREMDVTPGSIYGAIRNNFVCKNFLWRYVENDEIVQKIEEVTAHKKYMKKVNVYKDGKLFKQFLSITAAADGMNVNKSMVRKFLEGKKDKLEFEWKFA